LKPPERQPQHQQQFSAAASLAVGFYSHARLFAAMTNSVSLKVVILRVLSVALTMGLIAIALSLDTRSMPQFSFVNAASAREYPSAALSPANLAVFAARVARAKPVLADEGAMPDLGGAIGWLNSVPLSGKSLRGKVVLVDFWTYTCINSLRPLPYVKGWAAKYQDAGLVVIGVHTPEFSFEHEPVNVERAVRDLMVTYPVAMDSNYRIWQAFRNDYWPAQYIVDAKGRIRYHHFGEGDYDEEERVIQQLLKENGASGLDSNLVSVTGKGVEAAPDFAHEESPESYLGYRQAERFASPERFIKDSPKTYSAPAKPSLNQWGLSGSWAVGPEAVMLQSAPGKVIFRFHSRDLNLILAPAKDGIPVRFKVTLDGAAPGENCGSDSSPDGTGVIREPRLYQLIRQKEGIQDRTFEIEFQEDGAQALDFTFG
jgi:thiol-disulfide isomerase/thioredoxin